MTTVDDICRAMEEIAPLHLAAEWDNVGLLVGDRARPAQRVMTCLTITPSTAGEAIREQADLIVTHHPFPFHPLQQISTADTAGKLLLDLIEARVSVYSAHTAYDSAARGINQQIAEGLELREITPLELSLRDGSIGAGRCGRLAVPQTVQRVAEQLKRFLKIQSLQVVGDPGWQIERVAIACGSGGDFLTHAARAGCQLFVAGEARFHSCLEAEARGMALLLVGHYASERFGMETLAAMLSKQLSGLTIWPSRDERDPLSFNP